MNILTLYMYSENSSLTAAKSYQRVNSLHLYHIKMDETTFHGIFLVFIAIEIGNSNINSFATNIN